MSKEDAHIYTEWLNDFFITSQIGRSDQLFTVEKETEIIQKLTEGYNFAVIEKEKEKLIGSAGLFNVDFIHRRAEFGIFIGDRNFWNRGYGSEATNLVLDFAFNVLNLHHIKLTVYSYNSRAIKCYEKSGFKKVGTFSEYLQLAGKRYDMYLMEILCHDFKGTFVEKCIENVIQDKPASSLELL
jgi:RimJ/RimL family protein N-acetyltransferase